MNKGLAIAALWGLLMAGLTLAASHLSAISANLIIAPFQKGLLYLLVPGLVVSALAGSMWPGALINGMVHFGLGRFVVQFAIRPKAQSK